MVADPTFFDRILNTVKDNWVLAIILIVIAFIVGIAELLGAFDTIRSFFARGKRKMAVVECRYLIIDSYSQPTAESEICRAVYTLDERTFRFDGGDIQSPRAFVFKGYDAGPYQFRAEMTYWKSKLTTYFAAEIVFTDAVYYRLRWSPSTTTYQPNVTHVSVRPVSENEFKRILGDWRGVIPGCAASNSGITQF